MNRKYCTILLYCFLSFSLAGYENFREAWKAAKTTKDRKEAAVIYQEAADLAERDRDKARALFQSGLNWHLIGDTEKTIKTFKSLLEVSEEGSNEYSGSLRLLGSAYLLEKKYEEAKESYTAFLKKPTGPAAWIEDAQYKLKAIEYQKNARENLERSDLRYVSAINGSENHEMMRTANILMASQILKNTPEYKDAKLPGGVSIEERYTQWNRFFKHRWVQMSKHGLLAESFADYGKYTLPEIYNMADYSEDPILKKRSEMLLHIIWTEWAVGQLNGVRCGGRTRMYQGNDGKGERNRGTTDTWRRMSLFFFDMEPWDSKWHPNPIIGCPRIMASTNYRLPDVIIDIAKDAEGKGEYSYQGKRPGRQKAIPAAEVPVWWSPWYNYDPVDTRMLAYDYCTPDYAIGCLFIDPTLPPATAHEYLQGKDLEEGYAGLSGQNRYTSIVFSTDKNARVVPQSLASSDTYLKTTNQHQSVQKNNIMIIQRNQKSKNTGKMRVFFGDGMKERLVENDGWFFLQEGNAYMAVKGFSRENGRSECGYTWNDDCWLHLKDGDAPVVFVMGRKTAHATLEDFMKYVTAARSQLEGQHFSFQLQDAKEEPCKLQLTLDGSAVPEINGQPIHFLPERVFDSPFFYSDHASGVVTVEKNDEKMILDFNNSKIIYQ